MRYLVDLVRGSLHRFFVLEGFDRAMALAGQAFAALLPLLLVIAAVTPTGGEDAADGVVDQLDLTGNSAEVVREAVEAPDDSRSIGVLSFFLLVLSALAFTRALQRMYIRAWDLDKLGVRGNAWGLAWLAAFCVYASLQPLVLGLFGGMTQTVVTLGLSTGLWLFTPWILVGRVIPWQRLLPQALLTSSGLLLLGIAGLLYLPRAVGSAAAQFGFIGVAFALLSWLFCIAFVLVVTAAVGSTIARPPSERHATMRS